jgi:predicted TIM-barrel fold metal-dependent hydrolase
MSGAELVARNRIFPAAAHHQHLMGPTTLATWHTEPMPSASLPPVLDALLRGHRSLIGAAAESSEAHKDVYAADARLVLDNQVIQGSAAIAQYWRRYRADGFVRYVVPGSYRLRDDDGWIVGTMVEARPDSSTRYARRLRHVLINVQKGRGGEWRIVTESGTPIRRPVNTDTITAADLVGQMNEAGITHGLIASMGYDLSGKSETRGERAMVQAENDWTVRQAAQFPGRLVVFCGIHPARSYSIDEMDRCSKLPGVRGIKLYIRSSVNLEQPADVEKVRAFVRAANERRLPLLVHNSISMRTGNGAFYSRIFLDQIVPAAPDIPIQLAHMGGGGPFALGAPDEALKVYADAAAAGDPRMKNLYFDVSGTYAVVPPAALDTLAKRMRTIGLNRILFGSDFPFDPLLPAGPEWVIFRRVIPLTNDELRVIADNVAPYVR